MIEGQYILIEHAPGLLFIQYTSEYTLIKQSNF